MDESPTSSSLRRAVHLTHGAFELSCPSPVARTEGEWPSQTSIRREPDVFGDDTFEDVEGPANGLKAQIGAVPVSEYVSYLAHG